MTENILDSEIQISGYKTQLCKSISPHTGGTSIYVREDIPFEPLDIVCEQMKWWMCGVKIRTDKGYCNIFALYRSPSCSVKEFLDFFDGWLEENDDCNKIIVVGDFNINLNANGAACKRTKNIIFARGYRQIVNFNTRVAQQSASLIDFVLTNTTKVTAKRQKKHKIGDHETIKIECELFNMCTVAPRIISIRDWKNIDYQALNVKLARELQFTEEMSVCEKAEKLNECVDGAVVALLPHKVIYLKGRAQCQPWYTAAMEQQRQQRNAAAERVYHSRNNNQQKKLHDLYKIERNIYMLNYWMKEKSYIIIMKSTA